MKQWFQLEKPELLDPITSAQDDEADEAESLLEESAKKLDLVGEQEQEDIDQEELHSGEMTPVNGLDLVDQESTLSSNEADLEMELLAPSAVVDCNQETINPDNVLDHLPPVLAKPLVLAESVFAQSTELAAIGIQMAANPKETINDIKKTLLRFQMNYTKRLMN